MNSHSRVLKRCAQLAALISIPALFLALVAVASGQQPTQEPTTEATSVATTGGATATGTAGEATAVATPVVATASVTPVGGPTATPNLSIKTVVRIDVDPGPFKNSTEFAARVMIDNVDHLASFEVGISYDPKRLRPVKPGEADQTPGGTPGINVSGNLVKAEGVGDIFSSSPRRDVVTCLPVADQNNTVTASCVTRSVPLCLGGSAGASGSGLLGTVYFKSKGGGSTTLTLTTSQLVLDDYQDCTVEVQGTTGALPNDCLPIRAEPNDSADQLSCQPDGTSARVVGISGQVEEQAWIRLENLGWANSEHLQATGQGATIPNRQQNADVLLTGGGSSSHTLLYIAIAVVVVVALAGSAGGGYLWYRGRRPAPRT